MDAAPLAVVEQEGLQHVCLRPALSSGRCFKQCLELRGDSKADGNGFLGCHVALYSASPYNRGVQGGWRIARTSPILEGASAPGMARRCCQGATHVVVRGRTLHAESWTAVLIAPNNTATQS